MTVDDIQEARHNTPSGWMELCKRDDLKYLIDALLESPPSHTGSLDRLSERTGISVDELNTQLEFLEDLDVVELGDGEYTLCDGSIILKELFHLNSAVNKKLSEQARGSK